MRFLEKVRWGALILVLGAVSLFGGGLNARSEGNGGPKLLREAISVLRAEIDEDRRLVDLASNITALNQIRATLDGRREQKNSMVVGLEQTYSESLPDAISTLNRIQQEEDEIVHTVPKSERVQRETRNTLVENLPLKEEALSQIQDLLDSLGKPENK